MPFALRALGIIALFSGCAIYGDGTVVASNQTMAREQFAQDHTCPIARVAAVRASPAPPPDDIADDDERAKMWNDNAKDLANYQFVVSGCGKTMRYTCMMGQGFSCYAGSR